MPFSKTRSNHGAGSWIHILCSRVESKHTSRHLVDASIKNLRKQTAVQDSSPRSVGDGLGDIPSLLVLLVAVKLTDVVVAGISTFGNGIKQALLSMQKSLVHPLQLGTLRIVELGAHSHLQRTVTLAAVTDVAVKNRKSVIVKIFDSQIFDAGNADVFVMSM